jgi:membrane protease YdiL (CAAX protease family)
LSNTDPRDSISPDPSQAQPPRRLWRELGVALTATFFLLGWDVVGALVVMQLDCTLMNDELRFYVTVKAGFLLVLGVIVTLFRSWRGLGFAGGFGTRFWGFMLPAWVATAISLAGSPDGSLPPRLAGWLGLGLLIALGEETLFRGVVLRAFASRGPRVAIILSSLLFGMAHLVGVAGGIDIHMVLAQVIFATGLGICFGWVRVASGSIWPCVIAHTVMDGAGLASADGVASAMRYDVNSYPLAVTCAAASLAWGIFLLRRPLPTGFSPGVAAAMPEVAAILPAGREALPDPAYSDQG